jgi:hypothetical protein
VIELRRAHLGGTTDILSRGTGHAALANEPRGGFNDTVPCGETLRREIPVVRRELPHAASITDFGVDNPI